MHSPVPTPLPLLIGDNPTSPDTAPRTKRRFNHLRKLSQPQPIKDRPASAYEAWLETAYLLAHRPNASREDARVMARGRSGSAPNGDVSRNGRQTLDNNSANLQGHAKDEMPTIRLIPHQDPRSNRPSLSFPPTTRTLPHEDCVIRIGRYSERDVMPSSSPNKPSAAPVGFKSKVVSRRHCEFWCSQGQWYIKDVKSSSGTFLNHIRLSQPNIESRPFPVNDGDVVQLGIDFRGGEEMIFRCVKIRVECNRGWQKTLNNYNVSTHKRLRDLGRTAPKKDSDASSLHSSQECSICLMSIAPCQSLFVAPCSHVWHYKCIRPILNDHKTFPQFLCPNCRAVTDLEAEVDDRLDEWWEDPQIDEAIDATESKHGVNGNSRNEAEDTQMIGASQDLPPSASRFPSIQDSDNLSPSDTTASVPISRLAPSPSLVDRGSEALTDLGGIRMQSAPMQYLRPITPTEPLMGDNEFSRNRTQTSTMDMLVTEGPMTPTNTAGPFVFDGSAGRASGRGLSDDTTAAA